MTPSILTAPTVTVLVPILNLRPPALNRPARRDTASPVGRWYLEGKTRTSGRRADELDLRTRLQGAHWLGLYEAERLRTRGQVGRHHPRLLEWMWFLVA